MRRLLLATALSSCIAAIGATDSFTTDFPTTRMPSGIVCSNADGVQAATERYRNVQGASTWFVGHTTTGNLSALAATCGQGGEGRTLRMTLPAVRVSDGAVVRWDARSMARHVGEHYRVVAVADGREIQLAHIEGENYFWTTRYAELGDLSGKDVQIAFETEGEAGGGFMLAVDNILVGQPAGLKMEWELQTSHYRTNSDPIGGDLQGVLTNYGAAAADVTVTLKGADGVIARQTVGYLGFGQEIALRFSSGCAENSSVDYTIEVTAGGATATVSDDYIVRGAYPRTVLAEHYTGTWCNNCPVENLECYALERRLGADIVMVEAHVNDVLTDAAYWEAVGSGYVFSIPNLVINRNRGCASTVGGEQTRESELRRGARAQLKASYTTSADGSEVTVHTEVTTAFSASNSSGRYRVGYLLTADVHDAGDAQLMQQNSPTGYGWEEYYYMSSPILPLYTYYDGVVIDGTTSGTGVAGSLPAIIEAEQPMSTTATLSVPAAYRGSKSLGVAVVLIDNGADGQVVNCARAESENTPSGVGGVSVDTGAADNGWYDLQGRRYEARPGAAGLYIHRGRKIRL